MMIKTIILAVAAASAAARDGCSWDYEAVQCQPAASCVWRFDHASDLTPSDSCRPGQPAAPLTAADDAPSQLHVAYAGSEPGTGMAVSWFTAADTSASLVQYGTASGELTETATGASRSYYEATFTHDAVLSGLSPATTYFYRVGDGETWSEERSFKTAPAGPTYPFVFASIGDMGVYNSQGVYDYLVATQDEWEFLHHVGDISYADDAFLHHPFSFKYEDTWNSYMQLMSNFTATKPWMVLPGNHEAECHSPACQISSEKAGAFANFTAFNNRFRMPSPESGGTENMWFSFDVGPVHFVNIDTETDYPDAPGDRYRLLGGGNGGFGDQLDWLAADLAGVDREATPWVIVSGHRPIYTVDQQQDDTPTGDCAITQKVFEDLLHDAHVDVYVAGHKHSAEVQLPTYANVPEADYASPRSTVHVINGAGGNTEDHSGYCSTASASWNTWSDCEHWSVSFYTVINSTALSYEIRDAATGDELTSFVLTK